MRCERKCPRGGLTKKREKERTRNRFFFLEKRAARFVKREPLCFFGGGRNDALFLFSFKSITFFLFLSFLVLSLRGR
jgi:hypothetical protein